MMLWLSRLFIIVALGGFITSKADDQSKGKEVLVKETVLDSSVVDIVYLGKNHECVLVTTKKGKLYYSEDEGQSWTMISDKVAAGTDEHVERVIVNPTDKTVAVVQATQVSPTDSKRYPYIYITENSGKDWRRAWGKKFGLHNWISHPKEPKWALVSWWSGDCDGTATASKTAQAEEREPCAHKLMFTRDLGKTFVQLTSYVVQFSWGAEKIGQTNRVYFSAFKTKEGDQGRLSLWTKEVDFKYVDIDKRGRPSGSVVGSVTHGNKFMISNEFILVARVKDTAAQTVNLMVSSDGAKTWAAALLPSGMGELEEKWYTVLDTSEGAVILHINSDTDGNKDTGRVFVSDSAGVKYSQSLVENVRSSKGDCEFDKVMSLQGIYLANTVVQLDQAEPLKMKDGKVDEMEEFEASAGEGDAIKKRHKAGQKPGKSERTVRTVISFDKGGAWTYLRPPRVDSLGKSFDCDNKPLEECQLNLHGTTSWDTFAPFYSSESSVGIIMATGNVGQSLRFEPDQVNTFLSRDGGLTWIEAHKGAYIYEFGDHGGLLVMADDIKETTQVVFSWNEGAAWYDFTVGTQPFNVDNVITEPNVTATTFVMYGSRKEGEGVLYFLKFDALNFPTCKGEFAADSVSSDYETWSPSDGVRKDEKCLLGQRVTYTRRKATAACWNGMEFERPVVKSSCSCTQEDFACDLGFARAVGSMECVYDSDLMPRNIAEAKCGSSMLGSFSVDAYRQVPGDSCNGGWQPQQVSISCPRLSMKGINWSKFLGLVGFSALAYVLYNNLAGVLAFFTSLFAGSAPSNPFEFGVDRSADKGLVASTKENVFGAPKKLFEMVAGPSAASQGYGKVDGEDNTYDLDMPAAPETIGELNEFVDSSNDDRGAFDSEADERRFQQERESESRGSRLSGGLDAAKSVVPMLAPAPGVASAVPTEPIAGGGALWQSHSIGMTQGADEDLL